MNDWLYEINRFDKQSGKGFSPKIYLRWERCFILKGYKKDSYENQFLIGMV